MISEFLTNSNWLNPQIDFLLWLQNIRLQIGDILDVPFISLTKLGELLWPTICICIVYWCIDIRAGLYLCLVNCLTMVVSQILKMTACIYRPWILNDAIKPSPLVLKSAGSYSFPSGHSMMAGSTWAAIAYLLRKKPIWSGFFIFLTLLIGFSRLYLGVHTPQDVIIGLLVGLIFIFTVNHLIDWCEKNLSRYLYILGIIDVFIVLVLCYILFKSYPLDYINGKLLVNPEKAISIAVTYSGWFLGLINGVILCRIFFPFEPKKGSKIARITRGLIGGVTSALLFSIIQEKIFYNKVITDYKAIMVITFFVAFYMTAIYPFIFSKIFKNFGYNDV